MREISNQEIADVLERLADLLEVQEADSFRVRAYREAADTVRSTEESIRKLAIAGNNHQLEDLPDIGKSIGGAIREYVTTGRLIMLERLEGQVSPEALFSTIPGIGVELAQRIHEQLNIDTLEELEVASHDGRLAKVTGLGDRRVKGIRDTLASMLRRSTRRRARHFRQMESQMIQKRMTTILLLNYYLRLIKNIDKKQ
jgi:DNA polymerase/3'-5' exonuclease PolX